MDSPTKGRLKYEYEVTAPIEASGFMKFSNGVTPTAVP
jgi:hypothetical protein